MTDNEIIKALECCVYDDYAKCHYDCPYKTNCRHLSKDAIDIINRQRAEIEQLKFEIAKLLPEGCSYAIQVEVSNKLESQIKSEAVKEFAEKLKNKIKTECNPYGKPTFDYDTSLAIMRYIDNLVKEIVGE